MRADFEKFTMPNGHSCFYRDRDHSYWQTIEPKDSKPEPTEWKGTDRLTGISTAAGGLDFEPNMLMRWAAKTSLAGVAALASYQMDSSDWRAGDPWEPAWLDSADSIWRELEREGLTYEQKREERGDQGTDVHLHALNALARGERVPAYKQLSDEARGYARGVSQFWMDHWPEPLEAEQVVINKSLGVAGRYDLRAEIDGKIVLLDVKTGGYISLAAHVQIAGYAFCAKSCGFGPSDEVMILQVNADGEYTLIPVRATEQDFICAVEAYRRGKRIKKEANADRREREKT